MLDVLSGIIVLNLASSPINALHAKQVALLHLRHLLSTQKVSHQGNHRQKTLSLAGSWYGYAIILKEGYMDGEKILT
jgi:hypothetical protein